MRGSLWSALEDVYVISFVLVPLVSSIAYCFLVIPFNVVLYNRHLGLPISLHAPFLFNSHMLIFVYVLYVAFYIL